MADLISVSWQYPDVTCARIVYEGESYKSPGFMETPDMQSADIIINEKKKGGVEVFYTKKMPLADEGPFLKEERDLIDAIAERLGRKAQRIRVEEELHKAYEQLQAERRALQEANTALRERIKELRCFYGIAQLSEQHGNALPRVLQGVVDLIPVSWQYPEITCARIVYEGKPYQSPDFRETRYTQSAEITINGKKKGNVEVFYTKKMPLADEGPFLKEERDLIDAIAERLGRKAQRIRVEEELHKAYEQLQVERRALQEANTALRIVLAKIEDEKGAVKEAVVANVNKIVVPILHALETEIEPDKRGYVKLMKRNLEDIVAPFLDQLSRKFMALTPVELRVCNMIQMGLGTKEIARLRHISPATVNRQRESIRRKLGLTGKSVNLATYLQTYKKDAGRTAGIGRFGLDTLVETSVDLSRNPRS